MLQDRPGLSCRPMNFPSPSSRLIRFNKPYGVLSQFTPEGRWRGLKDFIDIPDVYVAGRLDADSEGLLLLTDDGKLQARIADPRFKMEKTYWVQVEGVPTEAALTSLRSGVQLNDGLTRPARATPARPTTRSVGATAAHPRAQEHSHRMAGAGDQRRPQPPGAAHDGGRGAADTAPDPRRHRASYARRTGARHLARIDSRRGDARTAAQPSFILQASSMHIPDLAPVVLNRRSTLLGVIGLLALPATHANAATPAKTKKQPAQPGVWPHASQVSGRRGPLVARPIGEAASGLRGRRAPARAGRRHRMDRTGRHPARSRTRRGQHRDARRRQARAPDRLHGGPEAVPRTTPDGGAPHGRPVARGPGPLRGANATTRPP